MDAYQNLISSDKRYNERKVIIADGSRSSMSILQHNVTFCKVCYSESKSFILKMHVFLLELLIHYLSNLLRILLVPFIS